MAQAYPNVWIELSGLPPKRLPYYFARYDLARLAHKFIFGSDWPGLPQHPRQCQGYHGDGVRARAAGEGVLPPGRPGHLAT